MALFDSIFGTPNKDKADAEQRTLMHNQLARGNHLHNLGTKSIKLQELAIRKYAGRLSEGVVNASIKAQGKANKVSEYLTKLQASSGSVNEGGRSRTAKAGGGRSNERLMKLSKLYEAENIVRFTKGERAAALTNSARLELQGLQGKAIAAGGIGVGARRGITYTKDNNALKFAKLAISIGSGNLGGLIADKDGNEVSVFQKLGLTL